MRADWIKLMIVAARLPLRRDPANSKRPVITHFNFEISVGYQHTLTPGGYNWPANVQFKSYCSAMLTTLRVLTATEPSLVHRNG